MALPKYFEQIVSSQGHLCYYCEHRMHRHRHEPGVPTPRDAITKDHLQPRLYGGPTTPENIVAACLQCNNLRGEVDVETFKNLQQKWFKRNPILWIRWHQLPHETVAELAHQCIRAQEARLRGKAIRYPAIAYIHNDFTLRRRYALASAA